MKRLLAACLWMLAVSVARAEVKLPALFCDHLIFQRDQEAPVWGLAAPGEEITIEFAGQKKTTQADPDGRWMVKLDPMPASAEGRDLKLTGSGQPEARTLTGVLVGDVWLCSGQSNMGWPVGESLNAAQEIASADCPAIRLFAVTRNPSIEPALDVKGSWQPCSPETARKFSGVGYFFGRELHKELKIPIGLLQSSVGGTPAEAWTSIVALRKLPEMGERAVREIGQIQSQEDDNKRFPAARDAWEEKYGVKPPPVTEAARAWADPDLDTADWRKITIPGHWSHVAGEKSGGVFWLRKEVDVPEARAGEPFQLFLNWIGEQYDTVFLNGVEVGRANEKAPDFYMAQRRYPVPGSLVKAGRNVLAVRIVSATQKAGPWAMGRNLGFPVADAGTISDEWLMKAESHFAPLPAGALEERPKPNNLAMIGVSSVLFNGMIAPLIPFGIKGAIWYQGESNVPRHGEYRELLTALIGDWRTRWGREFPFYIQQLVNNGPVVKDANQRAGWPWLREAQMQVAENLPDCGIAVGIELGDPFTIHPPNKQEVGRRLALVALEKCYGKKLESSGPRYESMKVEGSAIRITFRHADGLHAKSGPLARFAMAGADRKFVWAEASIDADQTVVVSSPRVPTPVAVRYAWADNPEGANLYNGAGLPAAPFRTDDWPSQ